MAGSLTGSLDPNRRAQLRSLGLVAPLVIYIGVTFLAPLGTMLTRSIYDPVVANVLPETLELLENWDGQSLPSEDIFATAAQEIKRAEAERTLGQVAARVNRIQGGLRSVFTQTARELRRIEEGPWQENMVGIDSIWADLGTWYTIQITGERFTRRHYESALDLQRLPDGSLTPQPMERRIYLKLFWRTLLVSMMVTLLCLILGYPIAHLIANSPENRMNWLLILVLIPFWTSLLVRTTSWIVLLQTQGVFNDLLVALGLISEEGRLAMVYNMTGTIIAMTHVLLPFMVLPLYSVMRGIPPTYMHAAASLGASPLQAFLRVYWPQSLPGVGAGGLLVFILAIGFFITPALVGGSEGQLISNMIAYHMQTSLNWGLAAALGGVLLVGVILLYLLYDRLVGIERMGLGQ